MLLKHVETMVSTAICQVKGPLRVKPLDMAMNADKFPDVALQMAKYSDLEILR